MGRIGYGVAVIYLGPAPFSFSTTRFFYYLFLSGSWAIGYHVLRKCQDKVENMQWLELLQPFTAVKNLYLSKRICTTYLACLARARWGQNNRSVTYPAEDFVGGARAVENCPGSHCAVCCCATGHRSPYSNFLLGQLGAGQEINTPRLYVWLTFSVVYFTTHNFRLDSFLGITCDLVSDRASNGSYILTIDLIFSDLHPCTVTAAPPNLAALPTRVCLLFAQTFALEVQTRCAPEARRFLEQNKRCNISVWAPSLTRMFEGQ
jgi:hypothetical protein